MSELDKVRARIEATEAEIAEAKAAGRYDYAIELVRNLTELQKEKNILLGQAQPSGPGLLTTWEQFCAHLPGANERVLDTVKKSFASRVVLCKDRDEAIEIYETANRIPRTETRAAMLKNASIAIDGVFDVSGNNKASFFRAYNVNTYETKVVKIPEVTSHVDKECDFYQAFRDTAGTGTYLVPMEKLEAQIVHENQLVDTPVKTYRSGILMPMYPSTLSHLPPPITPAFAVRLVDSMRDTLLMVRSRGWKHGDVKSSNIFIDVAGQPWLGDFGTCFRDASKFTGGTPQYQCTDVGHDAPTFDFVGLVISVLEKLGKLTIGSRWEQVESSVLKAHVETVEDETLKQKLLELFSI